MPLEIERKFLLANDAWRDEVVRSYPIRQGYLNTDPERTVRIRTSGDRAWLTVKGRGDGLVRPEYEYPIPHADALALLALCEPGLVEKTRHEVRRGSHIWEVDVFSGENEGLVLAEIELTAADEAFEQPDWLGAEVTEDSRYTNAALARHSFSTWP